MAEDARPHPGPLPQERENSPSPADGSYAAAAIPTPYQILGLRLRPFSFGHWLLLQRFENAFIQQDGRATQADLLLGVLICSMKYDKFLKFITQKNLAAEMRRWGKRIGRFELKEKGKLFLDYLEAAVHEPVFVSLRPQGTDGGADWAQNLKLTAITRLGYAEREFFDVPLAQVISEYYELAESEGHIRRLSPKDLAAAEANAKAAEALAALAPKDDGGLKMEDGKADSTLRTPHSALEGICPA